VKYLCDRRRHWIERLFWIFAFLISFISCSYVISKVYDKWQTSPVIVSFAEKSTPVYDIPFPAVTICPETKAMKNIVDFTKGFLALTANKPEFSRENLTVDELQTLEAVAQICDPHLLKNFTINSGLKPEEIVPLLKSVSMTLNETTFFCRWRNKIEPCGTLFTEILTEEGFCYTFNNLNSSETFNEDL
jgi:acid-sensing ion channel, other